MLQKCTNCLAIKALTEYYTKKKWWHDIRTECKDCMKNKARESYKQKKIHKMITKLVEVEAPPIERELWLLKLAIVWFILLSFVWLAYWFICILG